MMTLENKVALVLGFGLILVVGILISDHFSQARMQKPANLLAGDPTAVEAPRHDPPLLDIGPRMSAAQATVLSERTIDVPGPFPEPHDEAAMLRPPSLPDAAAPVGDQPASTEVIFHDVRPGESLSAICGRHYGDPSLAAVLARYNGIVDPDVLRAGHRLRVPAAAAIVPGVAPHRPGPEGDRTQPRTYTIKPGDSLSEIAERLLDSSHKWEELYELNRNVISDPDNIQAGVVINLPT